MADAASNPKPRLRWVLLAAAVVGVVACCGGLSYYSVVPQNGIRVERLKADLEEHLPEGSSREQARAWFASHGIEPFLIVDNNRCQIGFIAKIPNNTLIEEARIVIELYFDDSGKLRKRIIQRVVPSL
jgi:hypothetical protein